MKVICIGLLFVFCAVFTQEREAQALPQTGYRAYEYFYVIAGKHPTGFEAFANFTLNSPDGVKLAGRLIPTSGKVFEFVSVSLANGKFTFRTQAVKGVAYSFEGNFLKTPPFPFDGKTPVLEGKLKKMDGSTLWLKLKSSSLSKRAATNEKLFLNACGLRR